MTNKEKALEMHKQWNGKLSVEAKCQVASAEDLAIAYTPGGAEPCRAIAKSPKEAYTYTIKSNTVAVVSDGSAVLGDNQRRTYWRQLHNRRRSCGERRC